MTARRLQGRPGGYREQLLPDVSTLGAQLRKKNDIPDTGTVGQQHHQAVDAEAGAGGWRHAVLERPDVVGVVMHRLRVDEVLLGDGLEEHQLQRAPALLAAMLDS